MVHTRKTAGLFVKIAQQPGSCSAAKHLLNMRCSDQLTAAFVSFRDCICLLHRHVSGCITHLPSPCFALNSLRLVGRAACELTAGAKSELSRCVSLFCCSVLVLTSALTVTAGACESCPNRLILLAGPVRVTSALTAAASPAGSATLAVRLGADTIG